jgi:DNA-directed RNA polymerase subunit RPC12/RpoP
MATYECASCGMAVNASCATCDQPLENDHLSLD